MLLKEEKQTKKQITHICKTPYPLVTSDLPIVELNPL